MSTERTHAEILGMVKDIMVKRMERAVLAMEQRIRDDASFPVDDGHLKAGMYSKVEEVGKTILGEIGNRQSYAYYVHEGTGIHANSGKGRKTPWVVTARYKGKVITWRTSGQKPQPFITNQTLSQHGLDTINNILRGRSQ